MTSEAPRGGHLTKADIWTMHDVADLLSVHPRTVRRMVERGELPAREFAGRLLFIKDQVCAVLRGEASAQDWRTDPAG